MKLADFLALLGTLGVLNVGTIAVFVRFVLRALVREWVIADTKEQLQFMIVTALGKHEDEERIWMDRLAASIGQIREELAKLAGADITTEIKNLRAWRHETANELMEAQARALREIMDFMKESRARPRGGD